MATKKTNTKSNTSKDLKKNLASFETDMKDLEGIVNQMNKGLSSLSDSVELFEKGMQLSKKCSEQLNQAEQVIQKVVSSYDDEIKLEEVSFED